MTEGEHVLPDRLEFGLGLTAHIYAASASDATPAVVIVSGYRDSGFAAAMGCRFAEMAWTVSWARLFAAAAVAAVVCATEDPVDGLNALMTAMATRGAEWHIDTDRIAVFASSGHVPTALSALMNDFPLRVKCAAFAYGYTLDLNGSDAVAEASKSYRFANPCAGRSIGDLRDIPLLLVRAGRDEMPRLNESLDAFAAAAIARNAEITLVNYAEGRHAFDLFPDAPRTRTVVRRIVEFLADELRS